MVEFNFLIFVEPKHTRDHIECVHMQILSQAAQHVGNSLKQTRDPSSRRSNSPLHTYCTFQTDVLENVILYDVNKGASLKAFPTKDAIAA
jgi:Ser-tRNA(Ala) deacylase AlaX